MHNNALSVLIKNIIDSVENHDVFHDDTSLLSNLRRIFETRKTQSINFVDKLNPSFEFIIQRTTSLDDSNKNVFTIMYRNTISDEIVWKITNERLLNSNDASIIKVDHGKPTDFQQNIRALVSSLNPEMSSQMFELDTIDKLSELKRSSFNFLEKIPGSTDDDTRALRWPIIINVRFPGEPQDRSLRVCIEHSYHKQVDSYMQSKPVIAGDPFFQQQHSSISENSVFALIINEGSFHKPLARIVLSESLASSEKKVSVYLKNESDSEKNKTFVAVGSKNLAEALNRINFNNIFSGISNNFATLAVNNSNSNIVC